MYDLTDVPSLYDRKTAARPFDTIHDNLRYLSLVQSLLKGRNASLWCLREPTHMRLSVYQIFTHKKPYNSEKDFISKNAREVIKASPKKGVQKYVDTPGGNSAPLQPSGLVPRVKTLLLFKKDWEIQKKFKRIF